MKQKISDLAGQWQLKKTRTGYEGPCPSCRYPSGFSMTERGNRLLVYCHAGGCSQAELWALVQEDGVMRNIIFSQPPPAKAAKVAKDSGEMIRRLWKQTVPAQGTLVEHYLNQRGYTQVIPPSLRFLPDAWHAPSQTSCPAMIAGVYRLNDSEPVALHRTYLKSDGSGKAVLTPNKMILGQVAGAGCPLGQLGEILAITEGIETGLSVHQQTAIPVWSGLSAAGLQNLTLPSLVKQVVIFADADLAGIKAARMARLRWINEGKTVKIQAPSKTGCDFNDVWK
jgi:putative DNA primase/helicase